jgi:hypothetical protein
VEERLLERFSRPRRRLSRFLIALCAASCVAAAPALAWQTAHGNPDNSGAVDVETAPAQAPLPNAPRLGRLAAGAGPVIAADGTVYVVNSRGKLMSFKPDGTPGWSRDIGQQSSLSSPALGSDGSIYVIGAATIRDHTVDPPTTRQVAELHKFNSGGAYLWHVPLPGAAGGLTTSAPPNVWRGGNGDVIFVPTVRKFAGFQARITAFSENGGVLADQIVKNFVPETTGGGAKWYHAFAFLHICYYVDLCSFEAPTGVPAPSEHTLPDRILTALPAAAIHVAPGSQTPLVIVSDAFQDLVGYAFTGSSFEERFRVHDDKRFVLSTPLAWPDGHAMITTGGHETKSEVMFAGFNMSTIRVDAPTVWAVPTALGNSRYALVHRFGGLTVMRGASIESSLKLPGHSIASAAASRNQVFVSTASSLLTFDKASMTAIAAFGWNRGGASPVAIGPQGHVYAIADDRLYIFPPAVQVTDSSSPSTPPAPTNPQSPRYDPPVSKNGHRLFACKELDGDDCGKQDHREIAGLFCAKEGYAAVEKFDVDTKKGKAETLQGDEYCSKKKCKVFDEIVCKN